MYTKFETFFFEISQQTLKLYFKIAIRTKILHRAKILGYVHQRPMVLDHGNQYEENPSSHHGGMHEDG